MKTQIMLRLGSLKIAVWRIELTFPSIPSYAIPRPRLFWVMQFFAWSLVSAETINIAKMGGTEINSGYVNTEIQINPILT